MRKNIVIIIVLCLFLIADIIFLGWFFFGRKKPVPIAKPELELVNQVKVPLPEGVSRKDIEKISQNPAQADPEIRKKIHEAEQKVITEKTKNLPKDQLPPDFFIIMVDENGTEILPDAEKTRTFTQGENDLTFTWNSIEDPWLDTEISFLNSKLTAGYPLLKAKYGPPAFSQPVNIRKAPQPPPPNDSATGGYNASINEIAIFENALSPNADLAASTLIHETAHAFHDDYAIGITWAWEEGMARLMEYLVSIELSLSATGSLVTNYEEINNPTYDIVHAGAYSQGGMAWYKILIEDPLFLVKFNSEYYYQSSQILGSLNENEIINIAQNIKPFVEQKSFRDWYLNQYVFNPNYRGYFISLLLFREPVSGSPYIRVRLRSGSDSGSLVAQTGRVNIVGYDELGNKVYETIIDINSEEYQEKEFFNILASTASPSNNYHRGKLKIIASLSNNPDVSCTYYFPFEGSGRQSEHKGVYGIVPEQQTGTVTLESLDGKFASKTLNIENGAFWEPSFYEIGGRMKAIYRNSNGTLTSTKYFNVDLRNKFGYLLVLSTDNRGPVISNIVNQEQFKEISWQTDEPSAGFVIYPGSGNNFSRMVGPRDYGANHSISYADYQAFSKIKSIDSPGSNISESGLDFGTLSGKIADSLNPDSWLQSVLIEVKQNNNLIKSTYSSPTNNGKYILFLDTGQYDLVFSKQGYTTKVLSGVTIPIDEITIINVELSRGLAKVYGNIQNEQTGESIYGATVYFYWQGGIRYYPDTDQNGNYSVEVFPATFDIYVYASSYGMKYMGQYQFLVDHIYKLDFKISSTPLPKGKIAGRVKDTNGNFLANSEIINFDNSQILATTDVGGNFLTNDINTDTYNIYARKTNYYDSAVLTLVVTENNTTQAADFVLTPKPGKISGYVKNDTGQAIDQAKIFNRSNDQQLATTNISGFYQIGNLSPGLYSIEARKDGYETINSQTVEITPNLYATPGDLIIKLIPTTGHIQGKITKSTDGSNLPDAKISVIKNSQTIKFTNSDTQGNYTINDINEDTYDIKCELSGYYSDTKSNYQIIAGNLYTINFSLTVVPPPKGKITGKILDEKNNTISDAKIINSANQQILATSDTSGYFITPDLDIGSYTIYTQKLHYYDSQIQNITVTKDTTTTTQDFILVSKPGKISGYVKTDTGQSIDQAKIYIKNTSTQIGTSNASGYYETQLLSPNDYTIEAKKDGYETLNFQTIEVLPNQTITVPDLLLKLQPIPDIKSTKEVDKIIAQSGEILNYTITVTNSGAGQAKNVVISDNPPSGADYILGSTYQDGKLIPDIAEKCPLIFGITIATFDPGKSTVIKFQVRAK